MKLFELTKTLLEYNRQVTMAKMASVIDQSVKREGITPDELLSSIEDIDPSRNKQYVIWLLRNYAKGEFLIDDGHNITKALINFESVKSRLPIGERDIGRITVSQLIEIVEDVMSGKKQTDEFDVGDGVRVLYNGPLGLLVSPQTHEASCKLGAGTKWCTSSSDSGHYNEYAERGDLYIWRDKSGEKYQFFFEDAVFNDEQDNELSDEVVFRMVTTIKPIFDLFKSNMDKMIDNDEVFTSYPMTMIELLFGNKKHDLKDLIQRSLYSYSLDSVVKVYLERHGYSKKEIKDVLYQLLLEGSEFERLSAIVDGVWVEGVLNLLVNFSETEEVEYIRSFTNYIEDLNDKGVDWVHSVDRVLTVLVNKYPTMVGSILEYITMTLDDFPKLQKYIRSNPKLFSEVADGMTTDIS